MNSDVTINAVHSDGTTVDVTAGVQALYDLVINSMDWGSGFLTSEDAEPVAEIARICGFEGVEAVERYVTDVLRSEFIHAAWKAAEAQEDWSVRNDRPAFIAEVRERARREFDANLAAGTV